MEKLDLLKEVNELQLIREENIVVKTLKPSDNSLRDYVVEFTYHKFGSVNVLFGAKMYSDKIEEEIPIHLAKQLEERIK